MCIRSGVALKCLKQVASVHSSQLSVILSFDDEVSAGCGQPISFWQEWLPLAMLHSRLVCQEVQRNTAAPDAKPSATEAEQPKRASKVAYVCTISLCGAASCAWPVYLNSRRAVYVVIAGVFGAVFMLLACMVYQLTLWFAKRLLKQQASNKQVCQSSEEHGVAKYTCLML